MSISLRDHRVKIYAYSNNGGDGFASALYTLRETRWASVSQTGGTKYIVGTAPEERSDVVFDFDPSVGVETNDLLIDGTDHYFARGMTIQTHPRAMIVKGEKISNEVFKALNISDWTPPGALDAPIAFENSVVGS